MKNDFHLLTPEYWAELEKRNPVVYSAFVNWLNNYKLRANWCAIFKANVDFYDLPADLQHGILSRFYFEAGGIGDQFIDAQNNWARETKRMFIAFKERLEELNNL